MMSQFTYSNCQLKLHNFSGRHKMYLDSVFADIGVQLLDKTQVFKLKLFLNLLELPASCYLLDLLGGGKGKTDPPFT